MADIVKIEIENVDIEATYGVIPQGDFLGQLEKMAPAKPVISNKNANIHGSDVAEHTLYLDEKKLTLQFALRANSRSSYYEKYIDFVRKLLSTSVISFAVTTIEGIRTVYHFCYDDMSSNKRFNGKWSEFTIKFIEPNPMNRQVTSV